MKRFVKKESRNVFDGKTAESTALYLKDILLSNGYLTLNSNLKIIVGKDLLENKVVIADLKRLPHLLIAGKVNSGKSEFIHNLILSLIYNQSPVNVRLLLIDSNMNELNIYKTIPHLLFPVENSAEKALKSLNYAVSEMENRYNTFSKKGVRDINGYNSLTEILQNSENLPAIVVIINELECLMRFDPNETEDNICRLAQMGRASGIHLVLATEKPSVDVITGIIKANITSRIAFAVSSMIDSRTIIDCSGAEKLLGNGDMLYQPIWLEKPLRIQGCIVADTDIDTVIQYVKGGFPQA